MMTEDVKAENRMYLKTSVKTCKKCHKNASQSQKGNKTYLLFIYFQHVSKTY